MRTYKVTLLLNVSDTEPEPTKWDWNALLWGSRSAEEAERSANQLIGIEQEVYTLEPVVDGQGRRAAMKRTSMTPLYDLPKGAKIYNLLPNGDTDGVIIFDHPDGLYSYCYLESDPEKIVHLSRFTPLVPHGDGWRVED